MQRLIKTLLRKAIFLLPTWRFFALHISHWYGDSYTSACCFLHVYHHIMNMPQSHCTVCLLRHTIPSSLYTQCKIVALQNGWKMLLMFHLCLTFPFFRLDFQLIFVCNDTQRMCRLYITLVLCPLLKMNVGPPYPVSSHCNQPGHPWLCAPSHG